MNSFLNKPFPENQYSGDDLEQVLVNVTQQHIDAGIRYSTEQNPVALAMLDVIKEPYLACLYAAIYGDPTVIIWSKPVLINKVYDYKSVAKIHQTHVSYYVQSWIVAFYKTAEGTPLSFSVDLPKHFLRAQQ
jgi:hypothetical protein